MTLTFTGTSNSLLAGPQVTLVSFGQITASFTGNGLSFLDASGHAPVHLLVTVTQTSPHTSPTTSSDILFGRFVGAIGPSGSSAGFINERGGLHFPLSGFPGGYTYLSYDFDTRYNINAGVTQLTGRVSAIPEPATLILLGTGLAGVVGAARGRRRAVRQDP